MKILTVQQPWAEAIADGHKLVENRTWSVRYRGDVAIHAGLRHAAYPRYGVMGQQLESLYGTPLRQRAELATGAVLAVARLVDLHWSRHCPGDDQCRRWGETGDVMHWVLADVDRLPEPVPHRGAQGLRELAGTTADRVRRPWTR